MNKKQIFNNLQELEGKYLDLVWYARSNAMKYPDMAAQIFKAQAQIERKYPDDIKKFNENSDWQHGFNSGMLACIRFIYAMDDDGLEEAIENFPELDT